MQSKTSLVTKLVQAGAGTGKTESLAQEVIKTAKYLYAQKKRFPQIIATTFTEQATAELRERIVLLAQSSTEEQWLREYAQDVDALQISTIHGVFAKLLHRHGALVGLDPEFTVISADEEKQIVRKKIRQLMVGDDVVGSLVDQYGFENAVTLLIQLMNHEKTFGAKSKPLNQWLDLIQEDKNKLFDALQIISNSSTSEYSDGLKNTVDTLSGFYKQAQRIKNDYEKLRLVFLDIIGTLRRPSIKQKGLEIKEAMTAIFDIRDQWKEESYDPLINIKHEDITKAFLVTSKQLAKLVEEHKKESGVLSFSDLEFFMQELVATKPEVLNLIKNICDFWFVDEFQDTSPLQKNILYQLFKKPWNAYFVGDPQQSIYLFRGSDKNVFEQTKVEVLAQGGAIENLKTNYRSTGDLIKFFNLLFSPLEPKEKAKGEESTEILLHSKIVDPHILIAQSLSNFLKQGFKFDDVAVLVRTNKDASMVGDYLSGLNVPVHVHTSGGFYEKREVLDALCLLDFILDPNQDDIFFVLARSPWCYIADEVLVQWGPQIRAAKIGAWKWLEKQNFFELSQLKTLDHFIKIKQSMPLSFVFEYALSKLGFFEFSQFARQNFTERGEANLRKILSDLRAAETQAGFNAFQFVQKAWHDAEQLGEEKEAASFIEPQKVNVMTIHKSKGLKFNCVILTGAGKAPKNMHKQLELSHDGPWAVQVLSDQSEDRISPLSLKKLKETRLFQESCEFMRLFYVATTRAAFKLNIIAEEDLHEQSWLGQLRVEGKLNLSEGGHEKCYCVKFFKEAIAIDPFQQPIKAQQQELEFDKKVSTVFDIDFVQPQNSIPKPNLVQTVKNQSYGTQLHAVFEQIKKFPEEKIAKILARSGKYIDREKIEKTLAIKDLPLLEIMKNGFAEWPFSFKHNEKTYSGRVDLWGKTGDTVWIIDYKSGDSGNIKKQMSFYAVALNKFGCHWQNIKAVVVKPTSASSQEIKLGSLEESLANLDSDYLDHHQDQI